MPTKIEWADMTINPVVGCYHCSPGCDNCYAERFAARMAKHPNPKISGKYAGVVDGRGRWTGKMSRRYFIDAAFDSLPKAPKRIFVGSMCDIFHENMNYPAFLHFIKKLSTFSQHTFIVLTKRPKRMKKFVSITTQEDVAPHPWPLPNVWLGLTVCNQAEADVLLGTPAAKRFVSVEPMLGPIDLVGWGGIRQGENLYPERWPDFAWPEGVPTKVRQEIESFWSWETYNRTPRQWADNAVQNCGGIALGSLVGVDNVTWKGSKTVRPYNDYRSYRTGRFVHVWNNMCRVVYDDGTFDYASYDGRFHLSRYPVRGTDKYRSLINWVICGGETGPGARPMHPDWVRGLRDQCQSAGVPFFFKSWGEWLPCSQCDDDDPYIERLSRSTPYREIGDDGITDTDAGEGVICRNGVSTEQTFRVGKRRTGRLLDGVEHNEFPEVKV